jgi:hypothetical protein
MASKTGKCTNFGLCSMADTRETITVPSVDEFSCPECGKMLAEVEGKGGTGNGAAKGAGRAKFAVAALAILLAGAASTTSSITILAVRSLRAAARRFSACTVRTQSARNWLRPWPKRF